MREVEWRKFREVYKGTGILLRSRYSGATSSTRKGSSPNLQSCIPGIALHVKLSSFDPMHRTTESFSGSLTDFAQLGSSNLAYQVISNRLDSKVDSLSPKPF